MPPLLPWASIERRMAAQGYSPEERAITERTYKQALEHGIDGEEVNLVNPTTQDREDVMARLTRAGRGAEPVTPADPGLVESLKSGFRESDMAKYLRENNPDLVSIGEPGPFQPAPGAKGVVENILHEAGRFAGQPLVVAGGALGALPLAATMGAQRAWQGSEAGETPGEITRHAAEEATLGLAMGKAGALGRQAAETTPAAVRAVARQVLPLGAEAETMGAGGEAIQAAEEGRAPTLEGYARSTRGGLALMGAARLLHGIVGAAGRRGPTVEPENVPAETEPGTGAGSTPPGSGGAETPPSEASEQPRWVEEEAGEGTGAGSTPVEPDARMSPASAGGPSMPGETVPDVLGMGLMQALDEGYVERDPTGKFVLTDAGLAVIEGRGTGGEQAPPPAAAPPEPVAPPEVPPEVPEEAIPPTVPTPGIRAQPPPLGPQTVPMPTRPEGLGVPPPVDPVEQLLAAARVRPPGKGVAAAGAAPGPPPSEAPAPRRPAEVRPLRPTPEETALVAPPAPARVEESLLAGSAARPGQIPPGRAEIAPARPVETRVPPEAPGRAGEPGKEAAPSRAEMLAALKGALADAEREIRTGMNPRGEPLESRDIESAERTRDRLVARLRELGQEAPSLPETVGKTRAGAGVFRAETRPPTQTLPPAFGRAEALEMRREAQAPPGAPEPPPGMPVLARQAPPQRRAREATAETLPTGTPGVRETPAPPPAGGPAEVSQKVTPPGLRVWQGRGRPDPKSVYAFGGESPILGDADYFALSPEVAGRFGPEVSEHRVVLQKPLVIRTSAEWRALTQRAGVRYPDFLNRDESFEGNFGPFQADRNRVIAAIRAEGHDGVIITPEVIDENGGHNTVATLFGNPQVIRFRQAIVGTGAHARVSEEPTPPGKPPKKGKSVTLGTGLGALGEFGSESAEDAALRAEADRQRKNPAVAKVLSTIREEKASGWWDNLKARATWSDFYRRYVDHADPLRRAVLKLQEKPPAEQNPYLLQALYQGAQGGRIEAWIKYQPRDYETGKPLPDVKSLRDIFQPFTADRDLANGYLKALHTIDLAEQGLEPDRALVEASRQMVKDLDSPRFRELAKERQAYTRALLDLQREFVSKKLRDELIAKYPNYIPSHRLLEEDEPEAPRFRGAGTMDYSNPLKRLEGSERDTRPADAALLADTVRIIRAVEKNRVRLSIGETLGRDPATTELVKRLTPKQAAAERSDAPVVPVYSRGKRVFLKLSPELYAISRGLDVQTLGTVERALAFVARKLKRGATYSPEFIPKNWTRDQWTAFITTGIHPLRSIQGMAHALKADQVYQDWLASGAPQAGWVASGRGVPEAQVEDLYRDPSRFPRNTVLHPIQLLGAISELVEEGTRIGAYEATRKGLPKGTPFARTQATAGYASREATVNFQRIGASTQGANAVIPFFNPGIQGPDRIVRVAVDNPLRFLAKVTASITVSSLYLWYANHDDPRYRALPMWEKNTFWHLFPADPKKEPWRIPKPWVEGVMFGSLPERFLDYLYLKDPKVFDQWGQSALMAFAPPIIPAGAALVENFANWSWFRSRPIVPKGLEGVEGRYQTTPYSSLLARRLGDILDYSPAKIDNLIQGTTGGVGILTTQGVDEILRHGTTLPGGEPPTRGLADVPGLRAFISRFPTMQAQPIQDFYDQYGKATTARTTYNMLKRREPEKADTYAQAHPEVFRLGPMQAVAKGLSANNKLLVAIRNDATLTGDQKKAAIDTITLESIRAAEQANEAAKAPATPAGRAQDGAAKARDVRGTGLEAVERGAIDAAMGKGPAGLQRALQETARRGVVLDPDEIKRRLESPTFVERLMTEKMLHAPTAAERERARAILDRIRREVAPLQGLRQLPKSARPLAEREATRP